MFPTLISEGPTGVLELRSLLGRRVYEPNCDLDKALALLHAFEELKGGPEGRLKDNYWQDGFNWYPGCISHLYWRCFYRFTQYEPLIKDIIARRVWPIFKNRVHLGKVCRMLWPRKINQEGLRLYGELLPEHNRKLSETLRPDVLFYCTSPDNFRTREIIQTLRDKGLSVCYLLSPSKGLLAKRDELELPAYFIHRNLRRANRFGYRYDLSGFDKPTQFFLGRIIDELERNISERLDEHAAHLPNMERMRPGLVMGTDDVNEIHPLLYAAQRHGIPGMGWQVGHYGLRQAAFSLANIRRDEYQWFDKLVVWGEYWKDILQRYTDVYPDEMFVIGCNKHSRTCKRLASPGFDPRNVLVPYEYFANTMACGRYMKRLVDLGFTVFFKVRPDERIERQIESYHLGDYVPRIEIVERVTDEFMARINIVAGSMSTFLFDMLPYGKETWVFDTEFRLLDEFHTDGFARLVTLDGLADVAVPEKADRWMDYTQFFNEATLDEVVEREILPLTRRG